MNYLDGDEPNYRNYEEEEDGIMDTTESTGDVTPVNGQITFNLGDGSLNRIEDAIIARVSGPLESKLYAAFSKKLDKLVEDAVREKLNFEVEAALKRFLNEPRQPTTSYGVPNGAPVLLADEMGKIVTTWLDTKVNYRGETDTGCGSSGNKTRRAWLLNKFAIEGLEKDITTEIGRIRTAATEVVKTHISNIIARDLAPGMVQIASQ